MVAVACRVGAIGTLDAYAALIAEMIGIIGCIHASTYAVLAALITLVIAVTRSIRANARTVHAAFVATVIAIAAQIGTKLRHRQITDRDRLTNRQCRDVVHTKIEFGNCLRARFHKDVFAAREHVQAHRIGVAIQDHLEILLTVDHVALGRSDRCLCGTVFIPLHLREVAANGHPAPTGIAAVADCKCNAAVLGIGNPIGDLVHAVGIQRGNIRGF